MYERTGRVKERRGRGESRARGTGAQNEKRREERTSSSSPHPGAISQQPQASNSARHITPFGHTSFRLSPSPIPSLAPVTSCKLHSDPLFHTIIYSYTSTLCKLYPIPMSQNISRGVPGINKQSHPVSAYINPPSTTHLKGHPGKEIPNVDATTSRLLLEPKRILTSTSSWQKQQPRIPSNPETTPLACSYRQPP